MATSPEEGFSRRDDVAKVVQALDDLASCLLRLRLSYAVVGLLYEWRDLDVDPLSADVLELRGRLGDLYNGLDFSLLEEWL